MESNEIIAPFVLKTYQMVNDPSLDNLIRWGRSNNSFIVLDSLAFSQSLLPAYFKHNNFSSFVRQLNTYGFKKVDPDRWEFASEWFLRGQTHLLKKIGRKKLVTCRGKLTADEVEEEMALEIARLKQEQKVLEQAVVGMNKRLEATERRPEQMMALLYKVAEDPEILPRMMLKKVKRSNRLVDKKRPRILIPPPALPEVQSPPSSSSLGASDSVKCEEDECYRTVPFWPPPTSPEWPWTREASHGDAGGGGGDDLDYFGVGSADPDGRPPPPYPFSLLGGGF